MFISNSNEAIMFKNHKTPKEQEERHFEWTFFIIYFDQNVDKLTIKYHSFMFLRSVRLRMYASTHRLYRSGVLLGVVTLVEY